MSLASPSAAPAVGVCLVGASAGSGKTYRLTQEVTRSLRPGAPDSIDIEGLVGVTYTKKAQAELEMRIRRELSQHGHFDRASQLPLALLGTVHAVGLRLLKDFALDAGLSPDVDVIAGSDGQRLLQAALERALSPDLLQRLDRLGSAMQLRWDARVSRHDWVAPVDDIMTLARNSRIEPERLPAMAQRSIQTLRELLPPTVPDGSLLEARLQQEIERAIVQLAGAIDGTDKTRRALAYLRTCASQLERGPLSWQTWAKLAQLDPAKKSAHLVDAVREAAALYEAHPRFLSQLIELIDCIFEAARVGMLAYAEWKAERGLLDYVDMIDRAIDVLSVPEVEAELRGRLRLVVVDEFQDTSPIQLALFARLHSICGRSLWVGDRKQCIFEYAGADPALMDVVTRWTREHGGRGECLGRNYRSRPELVDFTSALFAAAFTEQGYHPGEVVTEAARTPCAELAPTPPMGIWWLGGSSHDAVADGIQRLLAEPQLTPVLDRINDCVRPVTAADIAVLVYTNAEAGRLAAALRTRGIQSVLPRVGLLVTPEGTLVSAALRFLVDSYDSLASAELDALTGFNGGTPDEWLARRIEARKQQPTPTDPTLTSSWRAPLEGLRVCLPQLSPTEVVDRILAVLDVPALAVRWPEPEQRLGNLEALRALASAYEERCDYRREAASLAGLLRYFEETQQEIRQRDEERATDEQFVPSSESAAAVTISTFHKSKGLEWPIVIVSSLDRERKRDAFEVTAETDRDDFDASDPLGGRWIRYWPWPLGLQQRRTAPIAQRAEDSAIGRAISEREHRERVRLLYVAFTRARDHLVLAIPQAKKGPSHAFLDELRDAQGPLLTLPGPADVNPVIAVRGLTGRRSLSPRVWQVSAKGSDEASATTAAAELRPRYWFAPNECRASSAVPSYWLSPSSAANDPIASTLPVARAVAVTRFARRMAFTNANGTSWDAIGTALHGFLAADVEKLSAAERALLAQRVLDNAGLSSMFAGDTLLAASDAFRSYVDSRWPRAVWHREVPISAPLDTEHGARRIEGTIDLLLETASGYVIIDHKSFPGRQEHWAERALTYAPQLFTYARAIRATGAEVSAMLVHFTVGGGVVEVSDG